MTTITSATNPPSPPPSLARFARLSITTACSVPSVPPPGTVYHVCDYYDWCAPTSTDSHVGEKRMEELGIDGGGGKAYGYAVFVKEKGKGVVEEEEIPVITAAKWDSANAWDSNRDWSNDDNDDNTTDRSSGSPITAVAVAANGTSNGHNNHQTTNGWGTGNAWGTGAPVPSYGPYNSSSPIRVHKKQRMFAVGLGNLGNTCYMNSSLQCLTSTTCLTGFVLGGKFDGSVNRENKLGTGGRMAESYRKLVQEMTCGSTVYPKEFKKTVGQWRNQFMGYEQHDR